jgi:hypothetical protein
LLGAFVMLSPTKMEEGSSWRNFTFSSKFHCCLVDDKNSFTDLRRKFELALDQQESDY